MKKISKTEIFFFYDISMKQLPDILSEGLLTSRSTSISMNDLTARTVAAALYNPSDDTFRKIKAYLNRSARSYGIERSGIGSLGHTRGTQIIDKYIRKQQEVLMTLALVSSNNFLMTVIPDPNIRYQIYTPNRGELTKYTDVDRSHSQDHRISNNATILNLASNVYSLGKRDSKEVRELIQWMDENCVKV